MVLIIHNNKNSIIIANVNSICLTLVIIILIIHSNKNSIIIANVMLFKFNMPHSSYNDINNS